MLIGVSAGDEEDGRQRDDDRRAADDQRDGRRDDRAEDEQQRDRGERQRDDLAPPQVGLRDRLDVAVERRAAGELDVEAGRLAERRADPRQRRRESSGADRQEHDVVGRVADRAETCRGASVCGTILTTYGASGTSSDRRRRPAASKAGVPAASSRRCGGR